MTAEIEKIIQNSSISLSEGLNNQARATQALESASFSLGSTVQDLARTLETTSKRLAAIKELSALLERVQKKAVSIVDSVHKEVASMLSVWKGELEDLDRRQETVLAELARRSEGRLSDLLDTLLASSAETMQEFKKGLRDVVSVASDDYPRIKKLLEDWDRVHSDVSRTMQGTLTRLTERITDVPR